MKFLSKEDELAYYANQRSLKHRFNSFLLRSVGQHTLVASMPPLPKAQDIRISAWINRWPWFSSAGVI